MEPSLGKWLRAASAAMKKDLILTVSAACALLSMLFVPPDAGYAKYIDLRVLCLLFCLMLVVAGFQKCGMFVLLAQKLLTGDRNLRVLSWILVMLPFFCSMLITNDVALITFVPFTILILNLIGQKKYLAYIVVLQTVAANLGSMATPVGNPQNLYLYGRFAIPAPAFFAALLPSVLLSFLLLTACVFRIPTVSMQIGLEAPCIQRGTSGRTVLYAGLFTICLLSVFRVLPYGLALLAVVCCALLFERKLLREADYMLLVTFVCFFVFAGNMGRIPAVRVLLSGALDIEPLLFTVLTSQVISNVPAAVLLSGFTTDWNALLVGADIGGLGTPIASLASLISLKFYIKEAPGGLKHYLLLFTAVNLAGLVVLYGMNLALRL